MLHQGIIVPTGTENLAKEPKFVTLFRKLKSPPLRCYKKSPLVFSYVCNTKFAAFCCFAAGQHVNGRFFANIDVFLLACIDH